MPPPLLHCVHLPPVRGLPGGRAARLHLQDPGGDHHPGRDDRRHQELRPRLPRGPSDQGLGSDPGEAAVLWPHDGEGHSVLADVEIQQDPQPGGRGQPGGAPLLLRH